MKVEKVGSQHTVANVLSYNEAGIPKAVIARPVNATISTAVNPPTASSSNVRRSCIFNTVFVYHKMRRDVVGCTAKRHGVPMAAARCQVQPKLQLMGLAPRKRPFMHHILK